MQKCFPVHFQNPSSISAKATGREPVTLRGSETSRGLLCPAAGHQGLLLSFEPNPGLFIVDNQPLRAFRAMKEFIIPHPHMLLLVLSPSLLAWHPATLTAGSPAFSGLRAPVLGKRPPSQGFVPGVKNPDHPACHTYPSD